MKGMLFTVQKALPLMPDGAGSFFPPRSSAAKGRGGTVSYARHQGGGAFLCPHLDH